MNGIILSYSPKTATGIIRANDGEKFSFRRADWREGRSPRRNDRVDFSPDGENATDIYFFQKEKKTAPLPSKTVLESGAVLDFGLIAAGYGIIFFGAAVLDVFFNIIRLDGNDIIGLFIILDILVAVAWISGTKFKPARTLATVFAGLTTALAIIILGSHALHGAL